MYTMERNIFESYTKFLDINKSDGTCMGMTLTWLGDILKESNGRAPYKNLQRTFFPDVKDNISLTRFYERGFAKQQNYASRYEAFEKNVKNHAAVTSDMFTAKYKDRKQRAVEAKNSVAGLHYRHAPLTSYRDIQGLDVNNVCSPPKSGVIIILDIGKANQNPHAVAAIRTSEYDTYFFDPGYGLFHITEKQPNRDIESILYKHYKRFYFSGQIVISKS